MAGSPLWKPDHEGGAAAGGRGDTRPGRGAATRWPRRSPARGRCRRRRRARARGRPGRSARTPWSRPPRARPGRGRAPRGRRRSRPGPTATSTGRAVRGVQQGVRDEVGDDLTQLGLVPRTGVGATGPSSPSSEMRRSRGAHAGVGDGVRGQHGEVDLGGLHDGRRRRCRASGQQVLDQPAHPGRLGLDALHRATRRLRCRARRPAGRARRSRAPWPAGCAARARRRRRTGASAPRWPRAPRTRTRCGSASR